MLEFFSNVCPYFLKEVVKYAPKYRVKKANLSDQTFLFINLQKQPFRGILMKRCSENMQQIYRRTRMLKCDFNKVALQEHLWRAACESFKGQEGLPDNGLSILNNLIS